ncbi:MAG: LytTR family transcriptional regulator [Bacteroidales bacterium]|nr:LytTR family transcriptional regulator [Bacteroidales bacterium]
MNSIRITDIILCVLVIPGMILFFPVGEWAQWNSGLVLTFVLWLYAVYFLCRKVIGPLFLQRKKGTVTAAGAVFLILSVNFLMTLAPVDIPREEGVVLQQHMRAMWILILAVLGMSLPLGMVEKQLIALASHLTRETAIDDARAALHQRGTDAVADEEILLKSGYQTVHVPLAALQYIESRNNYSCFHLDHLEDVVSQIPLKDVLDLLPEGKFVRIHRSYIVPLWRIEKRTMTYVKIMGMQDPLPVGRAYKDVLKNG